MSFNVDFRGVHYLIYLGSFWSYTQTLRKAVHEQVYTGHYHRQPLVVSYLESKEGTAMYCRCGNILVYETISQITDVAQRTNITTPIFCPTDGSTLRRVYLQDQRLSVGKLRSVSVTLIGIHNGIHITSGVFNC